MNGWMNGLWMDGWMMDGWMNEMDDWMDGWVAWNRPEMPGKHGSIPGNH